MMDTRMSWDTYFMGLAEYVAKRSTCLRRQIGAVIVRDKKILATGYNGAPPGLKHCEEIGCKRQVLDIPSGQRQEICRAVHSEQNALIQCAKHGVSTDGATIYVTTKPCVTCIKLIISAGIKRVVVKDWYPDELSDEIIKESGIEVTWVRDIICPIPAKVAEIDFELLDNEK
jgi:dCMP deaminase